VRVANLPHEKVRTFFHELGPKGEDAYMTIEQQLLEEGRAEGRAEILLRQLSIRFGPVSKRIETRVRKANPEELDRWAERVLTVASIREVFSG
jgi:hypothetical protein